MCRFGPLVKHWTMRYEAKHSYFKKLAQNVRNFKNISLTLEKDINTYSATSTQMEDPHFKRIQRLDQVHIIHDM